MIIKRFITCAAAAAMALSFCAVSALAETQTIFESEKEIQLVTDDGSTAEAAIMQEGEYDNFTVTFNLEDYANQGSYAQLMAYDTENNPLMYINMYFAGDEYHYVCGNGSYEWSNDNNYMTEQDGSRGAFNIDIKIVVEDGQSKMYVDDTFITSIPTSAKNLGKFVATPTVSGKWQQFTISDLIVTTEAEDEPTGVAATKVEVVADEGETADAVGFTYNYTENSSSTIKWIVSNGTDTKEIEGKSPVISTTGEAIIGLLITDVPEELVDGMTATVVIE